MPSKLPYLLILTYVILNSASNILLDVVDAENEEIKYSIKVALMAVICCMVAVYLGLNYKHACLAAKTMEQPVKVPKGMGIGMQMPPSNSEGWIKLEGVIMGQVARENILPIIS